MSSFAEVAMLNAWSSEHLEVGSAEGSSDMVLIGDVAKGLGAKLRSLSFGGPSTLESAVSEELRRLRAPG